MKQDSFLSTLAACLVLCALAPSPTASGYEPQLAEIRVFSGNFAPRGWAFCEGQLLPISSNQSLFSLLGTIYGGDGRTTFALPDLREAEKSLRKGGEGGGLRYIIALVGTYPARDSDAAEAKNTDRAPSEDTDSTVAFRCGTGLPGAPVFTVRLKADAHSDTVRGEGAVVQAVNPPLDFRVPLTGHFETDGDAVEVTAVGGAPGATAQLVLVLPDGWDSPGKASFSWYADRKWGDSGGAVPAAPAGDEALADRSKPRRDGSHGRPSEKAPHVESASRPPDREKIAAAREHFLGIAGPGKVTEQMLDLDDNKKVEDADLAYLEHMPALTGLHLKGTRIGDDGAKHIAHLVNLEQLNLRSTQVTSEGAVHLADLRKLRALVLVDTALTDEGLAHLKPLTSLKLVDLKNVELTDAGLACLAGSTGLQRLYLDNTGVTDQAFETVSRFSELEKLSLTGTAVTGEGFEQLKTLKKLTVLWLDDTKVTDDSLEGLKFIPSIRSLVLSNNNITDACVPHLLKLNLNELVLEECSGVTDKAVEELRKSFTVSGRGT